nr:MAG TPA: hypothetical protein [Caudoviricetes sp.]
MTECIIDTEKTPPVARDLILREAGSLEEVVRCRECKYFVQDLGGLCRLNGGDVLVYTIPSGFCNYGERRS